MSIQQFVRHCLLCQMTILQTPNYNQIHLEVSQMPMNFISMDLIGPFEMILRGNPDMPISSSPAQTWTLSSMHP